MNKLDSFITEYNCNGKLNVILVLTKRAGDDSTKRDLKQVLGTRNERDFPN